MSEPLPQKLQGFGLGTGNMTTRNEFKTILKGSSVHAIAQGCLRLTGRVKVAVPVCPKC